MKRLLVMFAGCAAAAQPVSADTLRQRSDIIDHHALYYRCISAAVVEAGRLDDRDGAVVVVQARVRCEKEWRMFVDALFEGSGPPDAEDGARAGMFKTEAERDAVAALGIARSGRCGSHTDEERMRCF